VDGTTNLDHQLERQPQALPGTKTADEILDSLAAYCQRINDSGHLAASRESLPGALQGRSP